MNYFKNHHSSCSCLPLSHSYVQYSHGTLSKTKQKLYSTICSLWFDRFFSFIFFSLLPFRLASSHLRCRRFGVLFFFLSCVHSSVGNPNPRGGSIASHKQKANNNNKKEKNLCVDFGMIFRGPVLVRNSLHLFLGVSVSRRSGFWLKWTRVFILCFFPFTPSSKRAKTPSSFSASVPPKTRRTEGGGRSE